VSVELNIVRDVSERLTRAEIPFMLTRCAEIAGGVARTLGDDEFPAAHSFREMYACAPPLVE
jgi:hypothetical protein